MSNTDLSPITIRTVVNKPVEKVWDFWTNPEHIIHWNFAHESWHSPRAQNDLRVGGQFNIRMEARDGSFGFDFGGVYDVVELHKRIEYHLGDKRKVEILFNVVGHSTEIIEIFDPETENSRERQEEGWMAIMTNFKKYAEG